MSVIGMDVLNSIKFHSLPYTHIVPNDVNAESYERGWNDAVDAIIEEIEFKTWIRDEKRFGDNEIRCSKCGAILTEEEYKWKNNYYCYHCGSPMMINRWKGLYECVNKTGSGTDVL